MALLHFLLLSCFATVSQSFHTNPLEYPEDTSSLTHVHITRAGLWLSLIDFLNDNPKLRNNVALAEEDPDTLIEEIEKQLKEGRIDSRLFKFVKSPKFPQAVQEIEDANVLVDSREIHLAASHFYNEKVAEGSRRLIGLRRRILLQIKESNYEEARRNTGRFLHTLQDFYSNTNWVEFGNIYPLETLGHKLIPEWFVAGEDEPVCSDCTPIEKFGDKVPVDDCPGNIMLTLGKLTSGYRFDKPRNLGKCSHGGVEDKTRHQPAVGGVNKESNLRFLSPHYRCVVRC